MVLRAELSALSLFSNLEQPEEAQERAVWVNQQEEREDAAGLKVELKAVWESQEDSVPLVAWAALRLAARLGGVGALAAEVHLGTLFNETF